MGRKDLGKKGEELAAEFLKDKGYEILTRNFRSKFGEIDIIAKKGDFLVFVEVKTRWSREYGTPEEAVTKSKLRSIVKTGEYFKLLNPETPEAMRIDVVAIDLSPQGRLKDIRLVKNAS